MTKIRHLNIEVTKRCNQRCFYCFNDSGIGSPASELTHEKWLSVLRQLKMQGLDSVHLTGGEPFVYRHAVELLAGAQELGLGTSILSNGFRIEELTRVHPGVFRKLTVAQISLDSLTPAVHNRRRGYVRAYEDAISAVESLNHLGVPLEISTVVDDENLAELPALADYAKAMNALLIVRPIVLSGRAAAVSLSNTYCDMLTRRMQELVRAEAPITDDRFHYVADERQSPVAETPSDFHTVYHDGHLRLPEGHEVDLFSIAA